MVEFGLKLKDNQVAEWADHYMRYERLKKILQQIQKRAQDFQNRHPEQARLLKEHTLHLPPLNEHPNETEDTPPPPPTTITTTTTTTENNANIPPSESSNSLVRVFHQATTNMTDYFRNNNNTNAQPPLWQSMQMELQTYIQEFDTCLTQDIQRVNQFYQSQLQELQHRLEFLKNIVQELQQKSDKSNTTTTKNNNNLDEETPATTQDDDHWMTVMESTPLISSKRKKALPWVTGHRRHPSSTTTEAGAFLFQDSNNDDVQDLQRYYREAESIQRALVDQYRIAKLLLNFAIMNYTGFVKIVKKYEKIMSTIVKKAPPRYQQAIQPNNICNEGQVVEQLASQLEQVYANWFCERNVSEARAQMLPKKGDSLEMDWSQLRLGYRMGMCAILGIWVCWDCIWGLYESGRSTIGGRTAFPVFRACGGILLLQWLWGVSVWVWSRYRVNYIYLFDLDPRVVRSSLALFNEAVDNTLVFLFSALLYYKAGAHDIPGRFPAGLVPFVLVLFTIYHLIFPLQIRSHMWKAIWLVVTTPATSPSFYHGYIGDIFTSMIKVFQDLVWTGFFIGTGDFLISEDSNKSTKHPWAKTVWYSSILIPLVTLLPLWFRFNQCLRKYADTGKRFPHLANALKYAVSQTVTLFGAFHPLYMEVSRGGSDIFQIFWTFAFVASSLYSFVWDVYMDWGLGRSKHGYLASPLMYPKRSFYVFVIAVDLVLRFAWVLTLVPPQSGASFGLPAYLTALSMMLELIRRTLWGFLRLENEHRTNASGHRRVGFVPLHFSTGHVHEYKKEKERSGFAVLLEIAVITVVVVGACVVAVVAAQQATEKASSSFEL